MRESPLYSRLGCFLKCTSYSVLSPSLHSALWYCEWLSQKTLLLNFSSFCDKMFFLKIQAKTLKSIAKFIEVILFLDLTRIRQRAALYSVASFVPVQLVSRVVTLVFVFQLVSEKKIDKNLLPPKKMIGKNSKSLVEKRQKELEVYLQTLLIKFPVTAPKVLSHFLHFHLYVSYVFSI